MSAAGSRFDDSRPRGAPVTVWVDGVPVGAHAGESVAAVLFTTGVRALRRSAVHARARGYWCGMGVCHECLVDVDGRAGVRACVTEVSDGMRVQTGAPVAR